MEFAAASSIWRLVALREILAAEHWRNLMTRRSKIALVALAAAVGFGSLALAESNLKQKQKAAASHGTGAAKLQHDRALNAYGSLRAPTYAVPNPNSPALTGGGSVGYNTNLYNW